METLLRTRAGTLSLGQYGPELDKRIRRYLKQMTLGESMKHILK
jgi:hypothetical protein